MIIDSGNFKISTPGFPIQGNIPLQPSALQKTGEKQFLLEGLKGDMFEALPETSNRGEGGPIYPTLGKKLFPALDAMETTISQLGKNPSPEDVDRSNIRRLIRAFQPVAEAFKDNYKPKKFNKAMDSFQEIAGKLGKYKDVSVIEEQVKAISPKGMLPFKIESKLKKLSAKRAEKFQEVYTDFRKEGMKEAVKILSSPKGIDESDPQRIEERDKDKMRQHIETLTAEVIQTGLLHKEPHKFHEGRKSLRTLLNSLGSSADNFGTDKKDIEAMTSLVNNYGIAQDNNIAYEWLHKSGFDKEAAKMKELFEENQQKALTEAAKFLESGALDRIYDKVR
jgi:hypothetical protein